MPNPKQPYNKLPNLPPKQDIETKAILKACTKAARALAEVKGAAKSLPDPRILLITLPLQEAKNSSAIENIITTTDKLFHAMALDNEKTIDPHTKEVLRYRRAMEEAEKILNQNEAFLTTSSFEKICTIIRGMEMRVRSTPGTKLVNTKTKDIIYTPPEGEDLLRNLLRDLEMFINESEESELDPLIKMAIIHYQFEAIHPFTDGNGRTGRILNIVYLMQEKLLDMPILYLSDYLIKNRDDYYKKLNQVTKKEAWEEWILFMLTAIEKTAWQTAQKIREIEKLFDAKLAEAKVKAPNKYTKEMLELTFVRPYIRIRNVERELDISYQTATKYVKEWERANLLSSTKIGHNLLFVNVELVNLFSEEE
ncbi:MAG: Fic family protein [Alphaproteobacteria bacterium]|nr:Fic family protein [Alphaproteobacteria bacterium]